MRARSNFLSFYCFLKLFAVISILVPIADSSVELSKFDILRDFKVALMHFSEPFLKGAKVDDYRMEGDKSAEMAKSVLKGIEDIERVQKHGYADLDKFKSELTSGLDIATSMDAKVSMFNVENIGMKDYRFVSFASNLKREAITIQQSILEKLETDSQIIVPSGWSGHAIVLIFKRGSIKDTFDLTVINTGDGIDFHYNAEDPDEVYPALTQIWVEFKDIPEKEIFSDDVWFVQALILMNLTFFESQMGKANLKVFFYRVILRNFVNQLVNKTDGLGRLVPMQRSGSCTFSSLMGALLYVSDSMENYYLYRLQLGHSLIKSLVENAKNCDSFKTILKNGLHTQGRHLFKGLASSLALQALQYLENILPSDFKHAGLLGSSQSSWIVENKSEALRSLQSHSAHDNIKTTVKLCNKVIKFLKDNPISEDSNSIMLDSHTISGLSFVHNYDDPTEISFVTNKSILDGAKIIEETPIRSVLGRIEGFEELHNEMRKLTFAPPESNVLFRLLDIFKASFGGKIEKLKEIIEQVKVKSKLIELLNVCDRIINAFARRNRKSISLDEFLILVVLQRLAWELTVRYDNLLDEPNRIGFGDLLPPQTLNDAAEKIVQMKYDSWSLFNTYDFQNYFMFKEFVTYHSDRDESVYKGPKSLFRIGCSEIEVKKSKKQKTDEIMMKHERLIQIKESSMNKYNGLADDEIKFIILLTEERQLSGIFPHYYKLMNILSKLPQCAFIKKSEIEGSLEDHWVIHEFTDKHLFKLATSRKIGVICFNIFNEMNTIRFSIQNLFYELMRSKTSEASLTSFEVWFNYIENSRTAKIFDSSQFQYITNNILNVPKIGIEYLELFEFDEVAASKVIYQLKRLIEISLKPLSDNNKSNMPYSTRKRWLNRAVNISILLTRFISRIDSDKVLSATDCAKILAEIYRIILPYSGFKSVYNLQDAEVSRVNFALSHICFIKIRNPKTFMESIKLNLKGFTGRMYRKTLQRYHWFVAKIYYILDGSDGSVADDQFKYGLVGSPLAPNETNFLQALLKTYFLKGFYSNNSEFINYDFKYHHNGYAIKILSSDSEDYLILNLWSGKIVQNGNLVLDFSMFLNSPKFSTFFKPEDFQQATQGTVLQYGDKIVYNLPNFRGNHYVMLLEADDLLIYRKYEDLWYKWIPIISKTQNPGELKEFKYQWTDKSKFFKNGNILILFRDNEHYPFMRFKTENHKVFIKFDYFKDIEWLSSVFLYNDSIKKQFISNNHLGSFDPFANYAKTNDSKLVIILTGYRFSELPKIPLILKESTSPNIFEFLHDTDIKICINQKLSTETSLLGALVAEKDQKKMLLIPLMRWPDAEEKTYKFVKDDFVHVQKIPLIENTPAPQSRLDKLLLVYTFMRNHNFDMAKEFLNPNTSIHQNEPFSFEELAIMSWIADYKSELLEVVALKIITFIHFKINQSKFPLDHEELIISNQKFVSEIENISNISSTYLFSMRELPEKYQAHRIFPEVLRPELFHRIFTSWNISPANFDSSKNSRSYNGRNGSIYNLLQLFGVQLDFYDVNILFEYTRFGAKATDENEVFSFGKRLLVWGDNVQALYCLFQNPEKWKALGMRVRFLDRVEMEKELSSYFKSEENSEILKHCKYNLRVNLIESSESTDLEKIRKTLLQSISNGETTDQFLVDEAKHKFEIDQTLMILILSLRTTLLEIIKKRGDHESSQKIDYFADKFSTKNAVLDKLNESINAYNHQEGTNQVTVKDLTSEINSIRMFTNEISDLIKNLKTLQEQSATELGEQVNFDLENMDDSSKVFEFILKSMHRRKQKTFESLYKCILEQDPAICIQRKFPQLNLDTCKELVSKSFIFFQRQSLIHYFTMILEMSQKILLDMGAVPVEDLLAFCDELNKAEHFDSRFENPVIINFEFRSQKYFVKPEQVADINQLTSFDETTKCFKSVVIQRMMAAGKTLVLGTNSIVTKALKSSETLSILVPPSSLYQSNTTAMQSRTYNYFKKKGKNFMFKRFGLDGKLSLFLDSVINIIEDTMKNRDYLILSPDSLQSFLNSYIEALLYGDMKDELNQAILQKYAKIYRIFKEKSSIILDEIDMTMDPKKELNFPSRDSEPFNMTAVALISDIMEFILFDKEIIETGLNIHSNNQASLTSENFEKCRNIILKYIKWQLEDETTIWNRLLFSKIKDTCDVDSIMNFLSDSDMTAHVDSITKIRNVDVSIANSLIIVKAQLYRYMEDALKGTVNFNYGSAGKARPQIKFAVPYVAANTPSSSSVFADRWETLLKTLIMISATPCSEEIAKEVIKYSRKAILEETTGGNSLWDTDTYKTLKILLPDEINPLDLDKNIKTHVIVMHEALSIRSPAAIRILSGYYITEVFAEMEFPVVQITSNALNMTSMFSSVQGYSGTIDNVNILPQETVEEAYKDHLANEKHNGGIALKLIRDGATYKVPELNESFFAKSINEIIKELLGEFKKDPISAIIDTGAFFKMFKNQQVAKAILDEYPDKDVVLYYDEDSNQLEFIKRDGTIGFLDTTDPDDITKATACDLSKRFTLYDQRHITGSDILQPINAHAVMTVGPRVLLRDILQGTLRMRQFMKSQQVHLVTTEATKQFYNSKIGSGNSNDMSVSDLLALGCINEDEKQQNENQKLAYVKIDSEIRSSILHEVSQMLSEGSDKIEDVAKLMQTNKDLFIRQIRENPQNWLIKNEELDTVVALKDYVLIKLKPLESCLTKSFEALRSKIDKMIALKSNTDSILHYLGDTINKKVGLESGTEVQVEVQAETNVQTEISIDNLIVSVDSGYSSQTDVTDEILNKLETSKHLNLSSIKTFEGHKPFFTSLADLYLTRLASSPQKHLVSNSLLTNGDSIGLSQDLCNPYQTSSEFNAYSLVFSKFTLEGSHFLIDEIKFNTTDKKKKKSLRVLLLSVQTVRNVHSQLHARKEFKDRFWLCDLSGSIIMSPKDQLRGTSIFEQFPQVSSLIFDLLVFNGSLPQILSNPILNNIYYKIWLNDEKYFKHRATFLLLRMKLLAEKQNIIFEDDDKALAELKSFATGKKLNSEIEKTGRISGDYQKGSINPRLNEDFMNALKSKAPNSQVSRRLKCNETDYKESLKSLFGGEYTTCSVDSFTEDKVSNLNHYSEIAQDADGNEDLGAKIIEQSIIVFDEKKLKLYTAYVVNSMTTKSDDGTTQESDEEEGATDSEGEDNEATSNTKAPLHTKTDNNTVILRKKILNDKNDTSDDETDSDKENVLNKSTFSHPTLQIQNLSTMNTGILSRSDFGKSTDDTPNSYIQPDTSSQNKYSYNLLHHQNQPSSQNQYSLNSSQGTDSISRGRGTNYNCSSQPSDTRPLQSHHLSNSNLYGWNEAYSSSDESSTESEDENESTSDPLKDSLLHKDGSKDSSSKSAPAASASSSTSTKDSSSDNYLTSILVVAIILLVASIVAIIWYIMRKSRTNLDDQENVQTTLTENNPVNEQSQIEA